MADNTFKVVLTKDRHEALREFARGQGVIAGQHGEIEAHGVKLAYSISSDYHPTDGSTEVEITVLHKPIWAPEGSVEEKIHDFIDALPLAPEVNNAPKPGDITVGDPEHQVPPPPAGTEPGKVAEPLQESPETVQEGVEAKSEPGIGGTEPGDGSEVKEESAPTS